jgi:uncharacterized protein (TIGR02145 family)
MAEGTLDIVITGQTVPATFGLAPIGWHIPSIVEWQTLQTYLGGNLVAGGKLKELGATYWDAPNTGADNSSGFSAVGSGIRDAGVFLFLREESDFWSSDEFMASGYYGYLLNVTVNFEVGGYTTSKENGLCIRPIKDDSIDPGSVTDYDGNVYPTVKIGTQVWFGSNLKVTHYNDGTPIPNITDNAEWAALTTGAMCYYNNTP